MRILKFLFLLLILAIFAIGYIYQQTNIIYFAYKNEQKKKILDELQQENNLLRYDTSVFSSLTYLDGKVLEKNAYFQMPSVKKIVSLDLPKDYSVASNNNVASRHNLVTKIFNKFSQSAEAKSFNP